MAYDTPALPATTGVQSSGAGCKAVYMRLKSCREPFLRRARQCAAVTIPWIMPPRGHSESSDLPTPFQSVGARGVNNLTSKLMLALFPPNAPFFKYEVDPYALEQIQGADGAREEVEQNLVKASEAILTELETSGFRVGAYEAARYLVVTGNALQYFHAEGVKIYRLDQYCVERDPQTGAPVRIVVREMLAPEDVPESVRIRVDAERARSSTTLVKSCELYTMAEYDAKSGKWSVVQECEGVPVDESAHTYAEDDFPFNPLRGNVVSGEDYGRSYVEEYLGDLLSLEGLAQAIVEGAAAGARWTPLVNPAGMTDIDDLARAENGEYIPGRGDDVTSPKIDKYFDFQVAAKTANEIEGRLSFAFLLNSAVQRNAERVTAEEIRQVAGELEQALGGIYSLLSKEWQLPLVRFIAKRMTRQRRLPKIPEKYVRPTVVTGIEAIGRGNDLSRLMSAFATFTSLATAAPVIGQYLNLLELAQRVFNAAGVRTDKLLKTKDELAQEAQAAQQAAMLQHLGPNVVNQAGGLLQQQQANNAPQQQ
jgi:hypothetical protein